MAQLQTQLTLEEFLALPQGDITYELINGEAVPKMSPKRFHSKLTLTLAMLLVHWAQNRGEVGIEWAVKLERNGKDWVPVPDLLYISYTRLNRDSVMDEACPVPPELAIEIISPDQTFAEMTEKATNYLQAGVLRVWVVDAKAKAITIFYPDAPPQTKRGNDTLADLLLEGITFTPQDIFQQARIP
ncbi:Uma2 family endonuclease [Calothrix sp. UHCC 0171]|uniref:Uma2 family endonuclease n=1 Tax=Calothrix sp. UHCC 0171 TaxID=3110245 RepID=UPI002B1EE231|nr:Uma2 family endonuclease [Calothrix sp. UHCC 0171]MEA5574689.1 Uma2 family endonuclease [Calothrix sp. UHCC 0171]